jgi:TonB-linked SusC/RagA family outer membrane protein
MRKLLLVMKITTFLITVCIMQVSASSFAQKITLNQKGITIESLFREISKQTGYSVFYSDKKIDQNRKINAHFKDTPLEEVLNVSFKDQPVKFTISDQSVLIERKEPTFLERLANRWASIDASGRVVDSENHPLPGASVKVKKTGKGVSTDKDGRFFLRGVEEGAVLVVSFIGYLPKEVSASANMGNVMLEQSLSKLDEVQVIAYGTTTQRLSTGNVTTIKADVLEKQPVNNPLLTLQGRVPGLFIEQATGFAGTGVKVRIQGQNSLNSGNDPLYLIDGVPYLSQLLPNANGLLQGAGVGAYESGGSPLSFINPADIESIDILKDADATAIYGSRAANGAILITTKKGKASDTRVNLNLQTGWAKVPRKLDLMNSEQYLEMRKEALKNDGIDKPNPGPFGDSDLNGNWDMNRYTDWQKELIGGTANYTDLQVSASGGSNNTTFLIGAGHHRETNVFPGDFSDVKSLVHFNINSASTNQRFKIQLSGSYLKDNNRLPKTDLTSDAINLVPVAPALYTPDGNINWAPDESGTSTFFSNPIGHVFDKYLVETNNLTSSALLSYQILQGLDIKTNLGYNNLVTNNTTKTGLQSVYPENLPYVSRNTLQINGSQDSWSIEPQLTFTRNISKGKFEILLGTTIMQSRSKQIGILGLGFSNDLAMDNILSAQEVQGFSSLNNQYKYNAVFGRINYNWEDKYILNLTARRDGSSRFGPENQFNNFAAVGLAWIFSQEKLIQDDFSFLSFGKFRGSYGVTGSDQIQDYQFLSLYDPLQNGVPYQGVISYQPNRLTNPYLQWEETKKLQIGLDLGFLKDKILFNLNYYRNRSSNQLSGYSLPSLTGFMDIVENQESTIQNSGWEFNLSSKNIDLKDFHWVANVNLTIPRNKLLAYPNLENSSNAFTAVIGQPLNSIKVFHYLGVDPATGKYQFADKEDNPIFSPNDPEDKTLVINPFPIFYGGLQNTFTYRRIQLDILIQFTKQKALNYTFGPAASELFSYGLGNRPVSFLDRWQKPGDVVSIRKYSTIGTDLNQSYSDLLNSDAAWTDASYVRLKNVSISWQLPQKWNNAMHLQNCNLFVQGQNLFTITNYTGLDPETKSSSSLPVLRVITLGVKVSL